MWTSILHPTPLVSPPTLTTVPTKPTAFSVSLHRRSLSHRFHSSSVPQQAQETEEEDKQESSSRLRGLDVLWAMQKATAEKNKLKTRKKNKSPSSSSAARIQLPPPPAMDYSNVKPLCMKREWGVKLDELESRLRQLAQEAK